MDVPLPAPPRARFEPNMHVIQAAVSKASAKLEQQLENSTEGEALVHQNIAHLAISFCGIKLT